MLARAYEIAEQEGMDEKEEADTLSSTSNDELGTDDGGAGVHEIKKENKCGKSSESKRIMFSNKNFSDEKQQKALDSESEEENATHRDVGESTGDQLRAMRKQELK